MSSTARGYERHKSDYYVTPIPEIESFLQAYEARIGRLEGPILDPCAGGDANNPMSYPEALKRQGYGHVETADLRPESLAEFTEDFLLETSRQGINRTIITNPPFNLAFEMLQKAFQCLQPGGRVIFLLRLNFLGSEKRKQWLQANPPEAIFVHSKRMSFTSDGKADSIEYAHFVWRKSTSPVKYSKLYVI